MLSAIVRIGRSARVLILVHHLWREAIIGAVSRAVDGAICQIRTITKPEAAWVYHRLVAVRRAVCIAQCKALTCLRGAFEQRRVACLIVPIINVVKHRPLRRSNLLVAFQSALADTVLIALIIVIA